MCNQLGKFSAVAALSLLFLSPAAWAAEVDFSCMKHFVRAKTIVTDRFKEYDVVLHNQCPGAVYWSMCIERIDPWTRAIMDVHTPTGYLEPEKKSRVNMQMKKGPGDTFQNRYQEFYVNLGFAIDAGAISPCTAKQCEAQNNELVKKLQANESAWKQAEEALIARLESECPSSGWDKSIRENCEEEVHATSKEALDQFSQTDLEIRKQLATTEPNKCRLHGGALVTH